MLKRIRIQNYKSLADVEVGLEPLTVLFGPNAAGKSNFLDALLLLSRMANSRTLKEAFDPPFRGNPLESFTFGPEGIKSLLKQDAARFSIEADVELSKSLVDEVNRQIAELRRPANGGGKPDEESPTDLVRERSLRYRLEVEIVPRTGVLRVTDEYLAPLTKAGEPRQSRRAFLEREAARDRLHLRMERQGHPMYFDTHLDHTILSRPHYPPHYPHIVAMRQELAGWNFFYFEPRERMRAASPVREVRTIGLMGEDLAAFLNTLQALENSQFRAIEHSLRLLIPAATGLKVDVNDIGEVELKLMEGDTPIPARLLSEGTLRILGLLALSATQHAPALIGFEEPENGVQPRRLELIAEFLKTQAAMGLTQYVITSHSPTLIDLMPSGSLRAVRRRGGRTEIRALEMSWGEMGRDRDVERALGDEEVAPAPVSSRLLRGDFDD